jgi:hypothetical protein
MIRGWTSLKRRLRRSPVLSEPSSEDTSQTAPSTITSNDDKMATWMKFQEDGFSRYSSSIYSQAESQSPNGSPGKPMQRPLSPIAPLFSSSPSGKSPVCCSLDPKFLLGRHIYSRHTRLLDIILTCVRWPLPVATRALTKSAVLAGLSHQTSWLPQARPRRCWGWRD